MADVFQVRYCKCTQLCSQLSSMHWTELVTFSTKHVNTAETLMVSHQRSRIDTK